MRTKAFVVCNSALSGHSTYSGSATAFLTACHLLASPANIRFFGFLDASASSSCFLVAHTTNKSTVSRGQWRPRLVLSKAARLAPIVLLLKRVVILATLLGSLDRCFSLGCCLLALAHRRHKVLLIEHMLQLADRDGLRSPKANQQYTCLRQAIMRIR